MAKRNTLFFVRSDKALLPNPKGVIRFGLHPACCVGADERGLFDFTPLEDAAAMEALADLRLAE